MKTRLLALLSALILLLGACASPSAAPTPAPDANTSGDANTPGDANTSEGDAATPPPAQDNAPAGETVMGEEYRYTFSVDITSLNYLLTNKSVDAEMICITLDPLVLVNNKGGIEPGIAESWSQSEDGTKWTFKLREGVQWLRSDGTEYAEVTAQDFVDAFEYLLDPSLGSLVTDFVLNFIDGARPYYDAKINGEAADFSTVGIKALDKYTVEYTTDGVVPFFLSLTTYSCYLPICKAFVEEIGGIENFGNSNTNYLGYSEFLFTNWEVGQKWELHKNEKYYYANRVHIPRLEYVFVADSTVMLEMYKRGEVSATPVTSAVYDQAMADPELAPYVYRSDLTSASWQYHMAFTNEPTPDSENAKPAMKNLNFRKAVFAAINHNSILSARSKESPEFLRRNTLNIWGLAVDENGKDYMTYGNLPKYEAPGFEYYDPAAAKAYLEAAKAELGDTVQWPVKLSMLVMSDVLYIVQESSLMKQSIEETLGVENVEVTFVEAAGEEYYEKSEAGIVEIGESGWMPDFADPIAYLEIYESDGYVGNFSNLSELPELAELERLLDEARSKTVLSERFAILAQAEEFMIENAIVLPHRANGGNFAINNSQDPYAGFRLVPYGLCNYMYKDLIYGTTPLTAEQRAAKKAEFEASKS